MKRSRLWSNSGFVDLDLGIGPAQDGRGGDQHRQHHPAASRRSVATSYKGEEGGLLEGEHQRDLLMSTRQSFNQIKVHFLYNNS